MNTLAIFLFSFGFLFLCIWLLLRYTRNTVGDNSPLKVERIYKTSSFRYFTKITNLTILAWFFLALKFLVLLFTVHTNFWYVYAIIFVMTLTSFYIVVFYAILDFNHWNYTEGLILKTHPAEHEIEIDFPDRTLKIKEGDIERIDMVSNKSKINFTYFKFYLKNGDFFFLSDRMPGHGVIQEYFKRIPEKYVTSWFPYIK